MGHEGAGFSFYNRHEIREELKRANFDLLVIGGGITGAGIALDAASRGLRTALLEKNDFASGTSSRSTKLIHGGLRYLKQLEFALVKEVGSERAIVHRLAPHLVIPEKMLLPLREKRGFGSLLTSFGLKLYDWLAGVTGKDRRLMLTRRQTLRKEPLLKKEDVMGGALYAEYRTDDARLTLEVLKKAFSLGAKAISYCEVDALIYENERVAGANVNDKLSGLTFTVRAKAVVNAAGPWVDTLREIDKSRSGKRLHLTKGVHIVIPREKLPIRQSIYFDVSDGRMIFAIPRGRTTYVGTTDTNYFGSVDDVKPERIDALYLIDGVNENFPSVKLTLHDIESGWAGLRPLIHEEGKSASALSRKDEIFESKSGLISIAGGKLTGYRRMSQRVVDLVIDNYFHTMPLKHCATDKLKLAGGLPTRKSVRRYQSKLSKTVLHLGLNEGTGEYLVSLYGKQADQILEQMKSEPGEDAYLKLLKAELWFAIQYEMVCNLSDFFVRRTGRLYFDIHSVKKYGTLLRVYMASLLNWTEEESTADEIRLNRLIADTQRFVKE